MQYPPSPPLSHHSNDSDDSLRALELSDGPIPPRSIRGRSYSMSGFDFQHDLLPLSASVSAADNGMAEVLGNGKDINLINGAHLRLHVRKLSITHCFFFRNIAHYWAAGGLYLGLATLNHGV